MKLSIASGPTLEMVELVSLIFPTPEDQRVAVGETLTFEVRESDGEVLGLIQGTTQRFAFGDQAFWGKLSYRWQAPTHAALKAEGAAEVYACAIDIKFDGEVLPELSNPEQSPATLAGSRVTARRYRPSKYKA